MDDKPTPAPHASAGPDFNGAGPQVERGQQGGSIDADDIRREITARPREFVEWLFPGTVVVHKSGRYAVIGDIYGQPGESLEIVLTGQKAGYWNDFASDPDGGRDLLSLFMASNNFGPADFPNALEIIHTEFLGHTRPEHKHKTFTITFTKRAAKHKDKPRPNINDRPLPCESYHYRDEAGMIIGVIYRYEYEDIDPKTGKPRKTFSVWDAKASKAQTPTPRPLYRLDKIKSYSELVFVEGERKADALASVGIEATCIMFGSNARFEEVEWSPIAGKRIVIWPDKDQSGWEFYKRLAPHLAGLKCLVAFVIPPNDKPEKWDAADCIAEGGDPKALIEAAQPFFTEEGLGEWDAGDDAADIEPRGWLLGNTFCRGFLSSLIGDGGVGKTSLRTAQLLSTAISRALTGEHVFMRCRVLIISLEDDAEELRRRVRAACLHHKIDPRDLQGWLFLAAPGRKGGKILTLDAYGRPMLGKLTEKIERVVKDRKIDIVSLDPFVKTHSAEENNNSMIDEVAQVLSDLAIEYDIAVDVPHHTSKGPADPGNANRGRGASAMKDAARLVYTLSPMSEDEAEAFGLSEQDRRSLVRLDSGKVNIAPPSHEAKWFRLIGVNLGNASSLYPNGDDVQTVEPWKPPALFAGMSTKTVNDILDEIDGGLKDGTRYTDASRAGVCAAWLAVAKHCPNKTEEDCRRIIKVWRKSGLLIVHTYDNPVSRKEATGLRVDPVKRP